MTTSTSPLLDAADELADQARRAEEERQAKQALAELNSAKRNALYGALGNRPEPEPTPSAPIFLSRPRPKREKVQKSVVPVEMICEAFALDTKTVVVGVAKREHWSIADLRLADQIIDALCGPEDTKLPGTNKERKSLIPVIQDAFVRSIGTAENENRAVPDHHTMGQRAGWFTRLDREVNGRQLSSSLADRMPAHLRALANAG